METTKQSRGLWWLAIGLGVLAFLGQEYARSADVHVNVNTGPPPIVVPAPPGEDESTTIRTAMGASNPASVLRLTLQST